MEQLRSLIKKLLQFRFVRFCITGGLNTLVDFIVFFLLTGSLNWPVIPSQVISTVPGFSTATVSTAAGPSRPGTGSSDGKCCGSSE